MAQLVSTTGSPMQVDGYTTPGRDQLAHGEQEESEENQLVVPALSYDKIETLQSEGVNMADIKKLKEAGFATTQAIMGVMRKELLNIKGISEQKVDKIVEACRKGELVRHGGVDQCGFVSCKTLQDRHAQRMRVSTGSSMLDKMIGGGVETCTITELYGEFRCGKTQICHTLAVLAQLDPEEGGAAGKVLYIDTEGCFRPERIRQIAESRDMDPDLIVENILVARCLTSEHLLKLISDAGCLMCDDESPYALIIVDSIMGVFRNDYAGRGELSERQQALGKCLSKLQKLSEEFNLAVVVTNQVMADPSGGMSSFAAAMPKPVGGHVLAHASQCRLFCRKGRDAVRVVKLVDHPSMPEDEASVEIYNGGIKNAD